MAHNELADPRMIQVAIPRIRKALAAALALCQGRDNVSAREKVDQPAFPVFPEGATGHASAFRGMSLRDYFAGQALAGMLAHLGLFGDDGIADDAYKIADAMLAAREDT